MIDEVTKQIHLEIDTAQERLLFEAEEIIKGSTLTEQIVTKAEKLKLLGFIQTPIVKKVEEKQKIIVQNRKQAEGIKYYRDKYPTLRFLTEEEFLKICNRYNLIYAPVSAYIKEIPDWNLEEIVSAPALDSEDLPPDVCSIQFDYFDYVSNEVRKWLNSQEWDLETAKGADDDWFRNQCPIQYQGNHLYKAGGKQIHYVDKKSTLFIAAPKSHFNLTGLEESGKFGYLKVLRIEEPKDPITYRYCKGGIQVLSKWGEVEDEDTLKIQL